MKCRLNLKILTAQAKAIKQKRRCGARDEIATIRVS
jgi:hypothetical protein